MTAGDEQIGAVYLRQQKDLNIFDDNPYSTESRAWCLQESVLSIRCLIFSPIHLYWCCQELSYAQCGGISCKTRNVVPMDYEKHPEEKRPYVSRCGRQGQSSTRVDRAKLHKFWAFVGAKVI